MVRHKFQQDCPNLSFLCQLLLLLSSRDRKAIQLCFGQRAVRARAGSAGIQHRRAPLQMRLCYLVFSIYLQKVASILPRTSPVMFARSSSAASLRRRPSQRRRSSRATCRCSSWLREKARFTTRCEPAASRQRIPESGMLIAERANFTGIVLGCIEAKFCK